MGILNPSSVHDTITKQTQPLSLIFKYFFTLPPTTLFLQRKKGRYFVFNYKTATRKIKRGWEKKGSYYSVHLEGMHLLNLYLWAQITFSSHIASCFFLCHFRDHSVLFIVLNHKNFPTTVTKWCFSCNCTFSLTDSSK